MVSALDPEVVLHRLVEVAVPRLADSCSVFVERAGRLHQVASRVRARVQFSNQLETVSFDLQSGHPLTEAYNSGEPVVVDSIRRGR